MAGFGLDTVGVAFPIDEMKSREIVRSAGSRRLQLSGGGFLSVGIGESAWVEASLPKRVRAENVSGVTADEAVEVVREMVAEACEVVVPAPPREMEFEGEVTAVSAENPRLVRVDLVRDFSLEEPSRLSPLLQGLEAVPRSGVMKVRRFVDGRTGMTETLRVGPGAWAATLYDKHAESGGLAERGSLRCEIRLRGRQLTSARAGHLGASMQSLNDLSDARCDTLRRAWFDRVGFGVWVGGRDRFWDELGRSALSSRERLVFAGWFHAREAGFPVDLCDKTERKYREIAREMQVMGGTAVRMRLDYDLGHEVLES